jgi:hypothetical protein
MNMTAKPIVPALSDISTKEMVACTLHKHATLLENLFLIRK